MNIVVVTGKKGKEACIFSCCVNFAIYMFHSVPVIRNWVPLVKEEEKRVSCCLVGDNGMVTVEVASD